MFSSVLALSACWRSDLPEPRFAVAKPVLLPESPLLFETRFLPRPEGVKEVHSAALETLPDGRQICIYYGGSAEAGLDVVLYQTMFETDHWTEPQKLFGPQDTGAAVGRYTRRIGNPSLYLDGQSRLHLFFVSVNFGGWAASSLNHSISTDHGVTWSPPRKLITSPFLNISTLVRNPAVALEDGGFYLPVYFELSRKFPELLRFDANGRLLGKIRMDHQHGSLQASVLPLDSLHAVAYLRNRDLHSGWLLMQTTENGGRTWTAPQPLTIPNKDSSLSVVQLPDRRFLLAYNPTEARDCMSLAISTDGLNWKDFHTSDRKGQVAEEGYDEYSYPTMLIHGDTIDLTYSYRRTGIRHLRFNTTWINREAAK